MIPQASGKRIFSFFSHKQKYLWVHEQINQTHETPTNKNPPAKISPGLFGLQATFATPQKVTLQLCVNNHIFARYLYYRFFFSTLSVTPLELNVLLAFQKNSQTFQRHPCLFPD
eukprot:c637_g1_i1.p1 GENE.c637_g1_i1~~c637_g1_i1.p1  ORF type:complete len:114 (-),score=7.07 c637_g1_i1:57-398(-)